MLTLDADLERLLKRGSSSPVFLVTIYPKIAGTGLMRFCTGDRPLRQVTLDPSDTKREQSVIPNTVVSIQTFGQTLDALNRSVSMSGTDVTIVDDGTIRRILDIQGGAQASITDRNQHLLNTKISISLGEQSLNTSKFLQIGNFTITEVTPSEGYITLGCDSVTNITSNFTINRPYKARDPYAQLDQILRHTATLSDTLLDRDSYDPDYGYLSNTPPTVDYDKRHYVIRQDNNSAGDPEFYKTDKHPKNVDAWTLINGISYVTRGFVFQSENGKLTYTPYVPGKAVSRHLTIDDVDTFEQSVMYNNVINRATHEIKSVAGETTFDPWSALGKKNRTPTGMPIYRQTSAYLGGVTNDAEYSSQSTDSADDLQYPDTGTSTYPQSKRFWQEHRESLDWCSGMSACSFLYAPTICSSGDAGMIPGSPYHDPFDEGSLYGKASYIHNYNFGSLPYPEGVVGTMGKLEISGYLNCTEPQRSDYIRSRSLFVGYGSTSLPWWKNGPNPGMSYDGSESLFVPAQSPVIRVTPSASDATAAQAEGVLGKEGLITRIDNRGSNSILYIDWNSDNTTEYTADWGQTTPYDWIILEPQFPVFYDLRTINTSGNRKEWGRQPRPHGVKTQGRTTNTTYGVDGPMTKDWNRYIYIQHASLAGFSGMGIRPQGWDPTFDAARATPNSLLSKRVYRGPMGGLDQGYQGVAWQNGRRIWGHNHLSRTVVSRYFEGQQEVPQLKPQERVTREGTGEAKSAYILLEYDENNTTPAAVIKREVLKCNQAYFAQDYGYDEALPRPSNSSGQVISPSITGALGKVHRWQPEAAEPQSYYDGTVFTQQEIASCCVFRVDCSTARIDTYTSLYGNPAATITHAAIDPVGRDVEDTHREGRYYIPSQLDSFVSYYTPSPSNGVGGNDPTADEIREMKPPVWFWTGLRATDITIARDVNQQILNRFAYGAPVIEITTSLQHIDIQLGDFISLDNDVYLRYAKSGSDSYTIFEVVRKEVDLEADSPRITFELVWVRQGADITVANGYKPPEAYVTVKLSTGEDITDLEGRIVFDSGGRKLQGISIVPAGGITLPPGAGGWGT